MFVTKDGVTQEIDAATLNAWERAGFVAGDAPAAPKHKPDWIAEAESLGLDTTGTVEVLKARIEAANA